MANGNTLVRVTSTNTTLGNPRRGWVLSDAQGNFLKFIEEGYLGRGAIQEYLWEGAVEVQLNIPVTPAVYNRLKKGA